MRRKTYGRVVLYEDKHSKMVLEYLGGDYQGEKHKCTERGGLIVGGGL
jgi:hypothetical protein